MLCPSPAFPLEYFLVQTAEVIPVATHKEETNLTVCQCFHYNLVWGLYNSVVKLAQSYAVLLCIAVSLFETN